MKIAATIFIVFPCWFLSMCGTLKTDGTPFSLEQKSLNSLFFQLTVAIIVICFFLIVIKVCSDESLTFPYSAHAILYLRLGCAIVSIFSGCLSKTKEEEEKNWVGEKERTLKNIIICYFMQSPVTDRPMLG